MKQQNSFRKAIEDDNIVLGARASSFSPALIEIYGHLGLDFVWLDFEHAGVSPWDSTVFEGLTRAAEAGGIELLVRIPGVNQPLIRKILDAGIRNLLVPRLNDAEQVRQAIEATRFIYEGEPGERGIAAARSSKYGNIDNYPEAEDESVCLGVMIEKATAVENLSEILSVPELGFIFIGPSDLSVQLGYPDNREHSEVQQTISDIVSAGHEASVPVGGIAHDAQKAYEKIQNRYQIIRLGGEFESVQQVLGDRLDELHALRE